MIKVRALVATLVAVLAIALTSVKAQDQTIVEIAAGNPDFSTLVSLVTAAGLVDTLNGDGPFTVFAPTNDAFAALPGFVVDYLSANPEALTKVLTYHVLSGAVMAADVSTMMAPTVEGSDLDVVVEDGGVKINGANVVATDIVASNGVIHVVDQVLIPSFDLPEVDALSVSDNIIAAGSSTVYPLAERIATDFTDAGFAGTITVDSVGTGAGFERFCKNGETDIATASRKIKDEEKTNCAALATPLTPYGFQVGIDALSVVVSKDNTFLESVNLETLAQIFSGNYATWADVNPNFPAEPIQLFSPGTDSGTFDYFVEIVFKKDKEPILNAKGIQLSEDDNVLVTGVEGSPYAIGYFGFAYFNENSDKLRTVAIENVEPSFTTAENGSYPFARPLFIYTAPEVLNAKPQVAAFVNYFIANATDQLGTEEGKIGYFPVNVNRQNLNKLAFIALTAAK